MNEKSRPSGRLTRSPASDSSYGTRARLRYPGQPTPLWHRLSLLRTRKAPATAQAVAACEAVAAVHEDDLWAVVGEIILRLDERGILRDSR